MHEFDRTIRLVGEEGQARLLRAKVALFGLGGVGSYALEALVRAGIGEMLLVDGDAVEETNLNRQLIATRATLGQPKSEVARARHFALGLAKGRAGGDELAVQVGFLHCVAVHQQHFADASAHQRFQGIGTHAAQAEQRHFCAQQPRLPFFAHQADRAVEFVHSAPPFPFSSMFIIARGRRVVKQNFAHRFSVP